MSSHVALKTVWIADLDLHCLQESLYLVSYCFRKSNLFKHRKVNVNLYYRTSKLFFGQVHYGHFLVPGQVENVTISTPMNRYKLACAYIEDSDQLRICVQWVLYEWPRVQCFFTLEF